MVARLLFGTVNSLTEWLKPASKHTAIELGDVVCEIVFSGLRVSNDSPSKAT